MSLAVNFRGLVDRDLLRRAKVIAAKSDTSINALFNAELRYLVETFEAAEFSGNQNYKVLLDFSLGRTDDVTVMATLGIDSAEDLFLLMVQARLPMPRLPTKTTDAMVATLHTLPFRNCAFLTNSRYNRRFAADEYCNDRTFAPQRNP